VKGAEGLQVAQVSKAGLDTASLIRWTLSHLTVIPREWAAPSPIGFFAYLITQREWGASHCPGEKPGCVVGFTWLYRQVGSGQVA
jgi:hypothetical protein